MLQKIKTRVILCQMKILHQIRVTKRLQVYQTMKIARNPHLNVDVVHSEVETNNTIVQHTVDNAVARKRTKCEFRY